jgi:transposase
MEKRQPPPGIAAQDWEATPNSVQALVYTLLTAVAEMQQVVPQLQKQIEQQQERIEQQQKRISQLEEQIGKTSRNSSKPPSSDPPNVKKPPPKAKRKRQHGGQPGHKGYGRNLKPPEEVTRFVVSKPSQCQQCGTLLLGTDPHPHRHQVCELPPIAPEIIEYQAHALTCFECGHKNRAPWPVEMATGSFGPRVQGLIGYLSGRFSVSRRDVQEMMASIFQVEISLGAVSAQEANLSAALEQSVIEAQSYVPQQAQINTDETSWKKNNKRVWLWTAATEMVTIFLVVATRGAAGFKQLMGTEFEGIVGSDRWSAYNGLDASRRQLCWAHLLRDFQAFVDRNGEAAVIGQALLRQAAAMFDLWHRVRDGTLSRPDFQRAMLPIRQEVEALLAVGTFVNHPKTVKTCANILKISPALWSFVEHEGIDPTNNAAERALRRGVLWRKRSFGSQSDRGLRFTERVLTAVTTLRQQQRNVLDFLALACQAHNLGLPAPSLLPVNSDVGPVFTN